MDTAPPYGIDISCWDGVNGLHPRNCGLFGGLVVTLSFVDYQEENATLFEDLARETGRMFSDIANEHYESYLESIEDRDL